MAAKRRRKVRYDRLAVVVLVGIVLFLAVVFGSMKLLNALFNDDDTPAAINPEINVSSSDFSAIVNNYDVYVTGDDLDFDFMIVELSFDSKEAFEYSFADIETEEKTALDNVYSFTKKVESAGYNLAPFALKTSVSLDGNSPVSAKVFVPVIKGAGSEYALYLKASGAALRIDTSLNQKDIQELKNKTNNEVTVSENFRAYISDSYASDAIYRNGIEMTCPPSMSVLTFRITVSEVNNGVKVSEAVFVSNNGANLDALDKTYSSMKLDNIINAELKAGDSLGLFFFTNDSIGYNGTLKLRLNDSNDWIEISSGE